MQPGREGCGACSCGGLEPFPSGVRVRLFDGWNQDRDVQILCRRLCYAVFELCGDGDESLLGLVESFELALEACSARGVYGDAGFDSVELGRDLDTKVVELGVGGVEVGGRHRVEG